MDYSLLAPTCFPPSIYVKKACQTRVDPSLINELVINLKPTIWSEGTMCIRQPMHIKSLQFFKSLVELICKSCNVSSMVMVKCNEK